MTITLYQIILVALSVVGIMRTVSHYLRGKQTIRELIAVSIFWSSVSFFVLLPTQFEKITLFIGFKNYVNAIIFFCLGLLFYIVFKLMIDHEKTQKEITQLVRRIALKEVKDE